MKKTTACLFAILSVLLSSNAGAQTIYDAFRFSDNDYYGTARSTAMGGAFTALGGDVGSVGINPAGSAVNNYSQVTLTPNLSFASTGLKYDGGDGVYGSSQSSNKTRLTLPNFGFVFYLSSGTSRGLKGISFGLLGNATANYTSRMEGGGQNSKTSYLGYLAASSDGYSSSTLSNTSYGSGTSWTSMVAYRSGMIATYDDANKYYVGATEKLFSDGSIELAGTINQRYGFVSTGYKYDYVFNMGFNIDDRLYLGVNMGLVTMEYDMQSYIREAAVDTDDFAIEFTGGSTSFDWARFGQKYSASGTGIYGKFGVIYLPSPGLRLGAAIQTPTLNFIKEKWQYYGECHFTTSSYDGSEASSVGEYEYKLISPYRANFGIAYVGGAFVLSADYELCDYGTMKFMDWDGHDTSGWEAEEELIKRFFGVQHNLRVGAEILLPLPGLALRAGYRLQTCPELTWQDSEGTVDSSVYEDYYYDTENISDSEFNEWVASLHGKSHVNARTQVFSLGIGYSSPGAFFCDLACRYTFGPNEYTSLYSDYTSGSSSPMVKSRTKLWDISLTFGWRF